MARWVDGRLRGVERGARSALSVAVGAVSRSSGSGLTGALGRRRDDRFAELDDCAGDGAAVPAESSRRLLADVFGLVRLTACAGADSRSGSGSGSGSGSADGAAGGSEDDSDSGSGSGSGAASGIVKRSPKSASCT